jgi:hypothetical protein
MPSLKDIKRRIVTVRKTQQITRAMRMVAAAKLRRAQGMAEAARPYAQAMRATLREVARSQKDAEHPLLVAHPEIRSVEVLVVSSDRGLCGGFNANVLKFAQGVIAARKHVRVTVVTAGRKAPAARSSTVTVGYGRKAVVTGTLVNSAGQPVQGARLSVQTAVDRGVPQYASIPADVVTSATGAYKFVVPAGPSVRVRIAYFARALDTTPAAQGDGRMKVTTRVTARAVHRSVRAGTRARVRGRIAGRYRPPGVRVELQGRRGRSW